MRSERSHCDSSERGNAVIEASLTLMLFLLILFSIFDFGFSLFLHQTYVHQARTAARWGAINPGDTAAIQKVALYNDPASTKTGLGVLGLNPANVTATRKGTAGGIDDRIEVTISGYNFITITPGWAGRKTGKPIRVSIPVEN